MGMSMGYLRGFIEDVEVCLHVGMTEGLMGEASGLSMGS